MFIHSSEVLILLFSLSQIIFIIILNRISRPQRGSVYLARAVQFGLFEVLHVEIQYIWHRFHVCDLFNLEYFLRNSLWDHNGTDRLNLARLSSWLGLAPIPGGSWDEWEEERRVRATPWPECFVSWRHTCSTAENHARLLYRCYRSWWPPNTSTPNNHYYYTLLPITPHIHPLPNQITECTKLPVGIIVCTQSLPRTYISTVTNGGKYFGIDLWVWGTSCFQTLYVPRLEIFWKCRKLTN